ncbi:hypothetical protein BGZ99_001826 [Dissophora globulifera]|uniref:Uncharacterized protein n=1 Tax=Dissophora globulifera TaxID=979702 RepID=A0A9P6UJW9_9FUNG|nr:hypothetical protein BGZ99_001826 [Dissophora globulifera]
MGRLEPTCFSSGSSNTLYALVYGYDLSITTGADNAIVAIIKSNSSPSDPNALTWQVVSTIHQAELSSFSPSVTGEDYPIQCLVDPNGGFLAWSYQANLPGQTGGKPRPGGFRYDPFSTTPSATTTGKGGWVNVDSRITYSWNSWDSTSAGGALMYLADGTGKYNFYQAFLPPLGSLESFINFGALNTAVTPNLMEDTGTRWNLSKLHGSQYSLYDWNGSKASGPISMSQLPDPGYAMTATGIFSDTSSTTYMLVQSGSFENASYFPGTFLKALVLTGASAGSVLDVPNNITVPNNLSFVNATGSAGGNGSNGDDGSGKTVAGLSPTVRVVLGIFGALIVIGLVVFGIVVRKRRQRKATTGFSAHA